MKRFSIVALLAFALLLSYYIAPGAAEKDNLLIDNNAQLPASMVITVTGNNYCLACKLASETQDRTTSTYPNLNALHVSQAKDAEGRILQSLVGKTLHYLPNEASAPLLIGEEFQGQEISVTGRFFEAESAFAVESFAPTTTIVSNLQVR